MGVGKAGPNNIRGSLSKTLSNKERIVLMMKRSVDQHFERIILKTFIGKCIQMVAHTNTEWKHLRLGHFRNLEGAFAQLLAHQKWMTWV